MIKNMGQLEFYPHPKTDYEIARERREKKENFLIEVIGDMLKKDSSIEIMPGRLIVEYNLRVADPELKVDINNNEDLRIIIKALNEKGLEESAKTFSTLINRGRSKGPTKKNYYQENSLNG